MINAPLRGEVLGFKNLFHTIQDLLAAKTAEIDGLIKRQAVPEELQPDLIAANQFIVKAAMELNQAESHLENAAEFLKQDRRPGFESQQAA